MDNEIIEIGGLPMARPPETVLAEAKRAADALQGVIRGKKNPVIFNKEQYIEFEDWQVLGRFYGLAAKVVSTAPVEYGGVRGFEARAVVVDIRTGVEVSAADSMCLNDEDKWSVRTKYEWRDGKRVASGEVAVPMFQLRSMAQTRACGKALRNVLAWVVVLAGYKPTMAEEMTGDETNERNPPTAMPARTAAAANTATGTAPAAQASAAADGPRKISEPQRKRFFAIWKNSGKTEEQVKGYLMDTIGSDHSADIPVDLYDEICKWAEAK